MVLRHGLEPLERSLLALLGGQVFLNADPPQRPQKRVEHLEDYLCQPKAAGVRKGFYDPYSNYGHYSRLQSDGISEWSSAFLKLSATLDGFAKSYKRFCKHYRHKSKGASKCHWGSRMLKRLVSSARTKRKQKRVSPGQKLLPFAFDIRLNQIPEEWHQIAVKFRKTNGIRDGDQALGLW